MGAPVARGTSLASARPASLPALALLFVCAGAAAEALPIGPAGAATQIGAGAAALITSGVNTSQALAAAVAIGALGVLSGAVALLVATAWRTSLSLAPRGPGGDGPSR